MKLRFKPGRRLLLILAGACALLMYAIALPTSATPLLQPPAEVKEMPVLIRANEMPIPGGEEKKPEDPFVKQPETEEVRVMTAGRDLKVTQSKSGKAVPGGQFFYFINFYNNGDTAAENVVLTDMLPVGTTFSATVGQAPTVSVSGRQVTWNTGYLPPGNSGSFQIAVVVDGGVAAGSNLENVVTITSSDTDANPSDNTSSMSTTVLVSGVDLSISKNASTTVPGGILSYVAYYYNLSTVTANNLVITDVIPAGFEYVSHDAYGATTVLTGPTLVLTRTSLTANSNGYFVIRVRVPDGTTPGTIATNVASISSSDIDVDPSDNVYNHSLTIATPSNEAMVSKQIIGGSIQAGGRITYELYISNYSTLTSTNMSVVDTLPANTTFVTSTGTVYNPNPQSAPAPIVAGNQITWNLGTLGPNTGAYIYPVVQVDAGVANGTFLVNQGQVSISQAEQSYANNTSSITTTIVPYGGPDAEGYTFKDETMAGGPTYSWIDATDGTRSWVFGDDRFSGPVPIGFNFNFYGTRYSTVNVTTNGFLNFGSSSTTYTNRPIPVSSTPNAFIAPFWDDLQVSGAQAIYYKQGGTSPNRYFVVEWHGVSHLNDPTHPLTFEAVLYEDGRILFQYQSLTGTYLNSGTVGIESDTSLAGLQYEYNENKLANNRAILFSPRYQIFMPVIFRNGAG